MRRFVIFACLITTLCSAPPACASFVGSNGKIAFDQGGKIYTINPDGTGLSYLIDGVDPAWAPDGARLAFTGPGGIWIANANGTGATRIVQGGSGGAGNVTWSPDGNRLAFVAFGYCDSECGPNHLMVVNSDGSGLVAIASALGAVENPGWSPDGTKLVVGNSGNGQCGSPGLPCGEIYTVRPDGTGITNLTGGDSRDFSPSWSPGGDKILFNLGAGPGCLSTMNPDGRGYTTLWDGCTFGPGAWSPDGSKIAFAGADSSCSCTAAEIYVMNAGGSIRTNITNTPDVWEGNPDWQPTQPHFLPRPKGATPFQTYLTVAYAACTIGRVNRSHGLPLGVQSCNPPVQSSDYLTVGTLDSNGQKANAIGKVRYDIKVGSPSTPADVKLAISITDVRNKSDLSDYTGELLASATRRITDKDNTPDQIWGNTAATVEDIPFSATVPCTATSDTTIGSSCSLSTTANALVPGQVTQNMRSIWQLDQVQVYDGGADGTATTTDNTLFMDEGIFVP